MNEITSFSKQRVLISRAMFSFCLLILVWRLYSIILPFQIGSPPLSKIDFDLTLWLYQLVGLQRILVESPAGSILFTILLFSVAALAIAFPRNRLFSIPLVLGILITGTVFNVNVCFNSHLLAPTVICLLPFCAKDDELFSLLWQGARLYICWVYGSAFIWKLYKGALLQPDFGAISFRGNLAWMIYENPNTFISNFYAFFLRNPAITNIGAQLIFWVEGLFLVGFFTRRFDKVLIVCVLLINVSICLFSDVVFLELIGTAILTLLPLSYWKKIQESINGAMIPSQPPTKSNTICNLESNSSK